MMKEYDPDCEVGKCAPLGKAEEGADSWRAAFGNLYNARHQKDGSSSKLPAPLVRLHQLYYNRDSSAGQGTVSGSGGSVGSRQVDLQERSISRCRIDRRESPAGACSLLKSKSTVCAFGFCHA